MFTPCARFVTHPATLAFLDLGVLSAIVSALILPNAGIPAGDARRPVLRCAVSKPRIGLCDPQLDPLAIAGENAPVRAAVPAIPDAAVGVT
jgi:hypothetical protein